jgi:hypothetical protein
MLAMDLVTKSVLRRPGSEITHEQLLSLPPVTELALQQCVVYIAWFRLSNSDIWIYIGSSVHRGGLFYRIYSCNECSLQYA